MSESSTSICVFGATGRMGSRVVAHALDDPRIALITALARSTSTREPRAIISPSGRSIAPKPLELSGQIAHHDVVVCFSSPEGVDACIAIAQRAGAALVVGSTGMREETIAALKKFSTIGAVLVAPNTSMGVCVLTETIFRAAKLLGPAYECSIVEAHHSQKKDAPSGTALRLRDSVRSAGHVVADEQVVAIRGGDVIGEHTVRFAGPGEYLEFTHRATSRDLFALGALRAAHWIARKPPGWYTMNDALSIGA